MSRTRAALTAFLLTPVLLVTGCSDDDPEPKFAPPSSVPPESPSTTDAAAVTGPDDAFAAWVEARNDALNSGDTSRVSALSASDCKTCADAIEPIEQVYAAGGHFDTDGWTVVSTRIRSETSNRAQISAAIRYEAGRTLPSADAEPVTYDVERHIVLIDLALADGRWLVRDVVYAS